MTELVAKQYTNNSIGIKNITYFVFFVYSIYEITCVFYHAVLFVAVIYYMVGLNPGFDNFIICMAIIVLVANISVSFGEGQTNREIGNLILSSH